MQPATYRLVNRQGTKTEGKVVCFPPKSEDFSQWASVMNEVQSLQLGHTWVNGFFDLETPNKLWLVNSNGEPSHYLETETPRRVVKGDGTCPQCSSPGRFVRMALVCDQHGAFAGI